MVAERREDTPGGAEGSPTSGAIPAGVEGQVQILLQLLLEQGRQAREDSRALSGRIDRLFYWILGFGSASIVGVVAILIKLFADG